MWKITQNFSDFHQIVNILLDFRHGIHYSKSFDYFQEDYYMNRSYSSSVKSLGLKKTGSTVKSQKCSQAPGFRTLWKDTVTHKLSTYSKAEKIPQKQTKTSSFVNLAKKFEEKGSKIQK